MIDEVELLALLDLAAEAVVVLRRGAARGQLPVIVAANRHLLDLAGAEIEGLLGRSFRILRELFASAERYAAIGEAAAQGEAWAGRVTLRRAGQPPIEVEVRAGPVPAPSALWVLWLDPRPAGFEAGTAEEAARRVAALTRDFLYELEIDVDCRLTLTWCDPRLATLTGYTLEELEAGGGLFALAHPSDATGLQRRNQRLLVGEPATVRYRLRQKDGSLRWIEDRARPDPSAEEGLFFRVIGIVTDLSSGVEQQVVALMAPRAALLSELRPAIVLLLDAEGSVRWVTGDPAMPLLARLQGGLGAPLADLLPAAAVDQWGDWLDRAATRAEPLGFRFVWPVDSQRREFDVRLMPGLDGFVEVVLLPADRRVDETTVPLQDVLNAIEIAVAVADATGRVVGVNEALARLLGRRPRESGDVSVGGLLDALEPATLDRELRRIVARGEPELLPAQSCRRPDGAAILLDLRCTPLLHEAGAVSTLVIEVRPVAGESPVPSARSQSWLQALMASVADGIVTLAEDGSVSWLSPPAAAILGLTPEAAYGRSITRILELGAEEARAMIGIVREAPGTRLPPYELVARRPTGEAVPVEVEVRGASIDGKRLVVLTLRDITIRRQTEETLKNLAYHDPLTGLPNRLLFNDRLAQAIERARRARQSLTVMLVDLDRFKLINESLGLERGDLVLKAVAQRLVDAVRKSDTVARFGGDEFLLLLLATQGADAAAKVAEKVLGALRPPFTLDGHQFTLTASLGIALFPYDGEDAEALVNNADSALSRAKDQSRNYFQFYAPENQLEARKRLLLEGNLRTALERGEFLVHYQPKVELRGGRIVGVEALLRWSTPGEGMVSPAEFIPLAEETGLIVSIGEWVLRTACAQLKAWHDDGLGPLQMAVNLSARQFLQRNLVEMIASAVAESGLLTEHVVLELTESVIMRDATDTARRLRELHALGLRFAIDDFGTGYSSLGYLKSFPIAELKIDRSFIKDIESQGNSAAIVEAIVALGSKLSLNVVAEGVETPGQVALLRRFGCPELQGFIFSRPLPAEELATLLRQDRRLEV